MAQGDSRPPSVWRSALDDSADIVDIESLRIQQAQDSGDVMFWLNIAWRQVLGRELLAIDVEYDGPYELDRGWLARELLKMAIQLDPGLTASVPPSSFSS